MWKEDCKELPCSPPAPLIQAELLIGSLPHRSLVSELELQGLGLENEPGCVYSIHLWMDGRMNEGADVCSDAQTMTGRMDAECGWLARKGPVQSQHSDQLVVFGLPTKEQ